MVPWVAAAEGPTVEEVCARFSITESDLAEDLELLFLCGVPPYGPDDLIEADISEGRVWIRLAEYFSAPLRLTPAEGLALVAAGTGLLAAPGTDPEGPLARALAKVAASLGVDPDATIDVELGDVAVPVLDSLRAADRVHHRVTFDYYSFGRDEWTRRHVDPYRVFSSSGQWYVFGHCHTAGATRLFRLDRIRAVSDEACRASHRQHASRRHRCTRRVPTTRWWCSTSLLRRAGSSSSTPTKASRSATGLVSRADPGQ